MKSRSHETIPGTWSTGRQLISRASTPISLEAPGRAAEEVALGRAPVLAVDAAHAVAAAPVGEPHGQPGLEQQLDHLERRRIADQRQRLEQQHVRRVVREHACEQLDRLAPARRVDLLGDRERDGAVLLAPGLRRRLARELDAEARDVDPVARVAVARAARAARPRAPRGSTRWRWRGRCSPPRDDRDGRRARSRAPGRARRCPTAPDSGCGRRGAAPRSRRRRRESRSCSAPSSDSMWR